MFSSPIRKDFSLSFLIGMKKKAIKLFCNQAGLTVVELLIGLTVMSIILISGYMFFSFGWRVFDLGTESSVVNNNLRMAAEVVSNEIRYAGVLNVINTADVPVNVDDDKVYIYLNANNRIEKKDNSGSILLPHELDSDITFNVLFTTIAPNTMRMNFTEDTSGNSMETEVRLLNLSAGNPIGGLASGQALEYEMGVIDNNNGNTAIPVTNITVTPTEIDLDIGETENITYLITPANATNQNVTWSPGNQAIATVSNDGVVTGVGAGSTTVTVTTEDGGISASSNITVNSLVVSVTGVSLNQVSTSMEVGGTLELEATITPADATNQILSWTTSNSSIASVDDGIVSAISAGLATIIVITQDGNYTDTCNISVIEIPIELNAFSGNRNNLTLNFNQEVTISSFNISGNQNNKMPADPTPTPVQSFTLNFSNSLNNNTIFTVTVQNGSNQTETINLKVTGQSWSLYP
jgi:uncharacterized protein YjdB